MSKKDKKNHSSKPETPEKKKGFHPALVISTIIVVVFVLWYCPKALMNARISQTEERAAEIVISNNFSDTETRDGYSTLIPQKKYTDYMFVKSGDTPEAVYAFPKYYAETAKLSFCLIEGKLYRKDIGQVEFGSLLPVIDDTWKEN